MLGLQSLEQVGKLQLRLALLDEIREQTGDPLVYLGERSLPLSALVSTLSPITYTS